MKRRTRRLALSLLEDKVFPRNLKTGFSSHKSRSMFFSSSQGTHKTFLSLYWMDPVKVCISTRRNGRVQWRFLGGRFLGGHFARLKSILYPSKLLSCTTIHPYWSSVEKASLSWGANFALCSIEDSVTLLPFFQSSHVAVRCLRWRLFFFTLGLYPHKGWDTMRPSSFLGDAVFRLVVRWLRVEVHSFRCN